MSRSKATANSSVRATRLIPAMLLFLAAATPAAASIIFNVTVTTASGSPVDSLSIGEEFTLDIRMSSTGSPGVQIVSAGVFGYDPGVVAFRSGEAVDGFLYDLCVPGGGCFQGIQNFRAGALAESDLPGSIGRHVRFAEGNSLTPRTATGAIDPGLDGNVTDAQFRVTFQLISAGLTDLVIGTSSDPDADLFVFLDGPDREQAINALVTIGFVPEPGTALLLGLGLLTLGWVRPGRTT